MAGWWISRQIPTTVNCSFLSRLIPLHTANTVRAALLHIFLLFCSSLARIFFKIIFTVVIGKNKQFSRKNWASTQCHKGSCQPQCTWQPMKPMAPNSTLKTFGKYWILLQNPGWDFWFICKNDAISSLHSNLQVKSNMEWKFRNLSGTAACLPHNSPTKNSSQERTLLETQG